MFLVSECRCGITGDRLGGTTEILYSFRCAGHLLVDNDRAGWFADVLEQKCERGTHQADQYAKTKSVNVTEKRTLLLKDVIENCERFLRRRPVAGVVRKRALEMRKLLLKVEVERGHVPNKVGLARLRLTRDQRGDRRDANASADVAHEIKNAGRVTHLFLAERPHGRCGHGHIH